MPNDLCPVTGKVGFPDRTAAKLRLAEIRHDGRAWQQDKIPRRAYRCGFCGRYHLTAQTRRSH